MFNIIALAMGLWPRVDVPHVAPGVTTTPLSWTPVGPEGGSVIAVYTWGNGDSVIAVSWPNLWMTTNSGASWNITVPFALFGTDDGTLTADRSILLAREGGLIIRSTDWGMSWDTVLEDNSLGYKILNQDKLSAVYTAGQDTLNNLIKFYRSTDGGATWTNPGGTLSYWDEMYGLAATPSAPNVLFFSCGNADSTLIYRSTDGGASWTRVLSRTSPYRDLRAIAVHPLTPNLVFAALSLEGFPSSGVLIVSTDMGNTWLTADSGKLYTHLNFYKDTLLLASSAIPEGIKRFNLNALADTAWIYTSECVLWTDDAGNVLWGGTNGVGVIRSLTGGVSWDERNTTLYGVWSPSPHGITAQGNLVYVLDYLSGRLYKSTDGGLSWTRNALNPVFDPGDGFSPTGFSIHAATANLVYAGIASFGTFSSFYRTTDGGASWTPVSLLNAPLMFSLADRAQDTLYGLGYNLLTQQTGVFKSIDRGNTWSLVRPYPLYWAGIAIFGDVKVSSWGHIFMTDTAGVSRSTNGGASWAQMSPNLQMACLMDTTSSAVFFTSVDTNLQGIWRWDNSSWQWQFYGGDGYVSLLSMPDVAADGYRLVTCWQTTGPLGLVSVVASDTFPYSTWKYDTLPNLFASSVTLTSSSVLLGTIGNGYFRADFHGASVRENLSGQNRMSAWISGDRLFLNLPNAGVVSVRIYDVSGRMREEVFSGELQGGLNSLELPGSIPSGVYIVKVDAGELRILKWTRTGR